MRTVLALLLAAPLTLFAQGHSHSGHDHDHGAPDLGTIGKAHLETSCNEAARKEIDRGVTLIHSFWYAEAEKSFRDAAVADAACGMAWWGVAMANLHPIWAPPTADELKVGSEAAEKATQIGAKTDRETAFIGAIATFEASTEKHPVTPGAIIPAREQLAEMLLEDGKRDEAIAEVQRVLRDAPGRRNAMELAKRAQTAEKIVNE
jgi:hypothetical protein